MACFSQTSEGWSTVSGTTAVSDASTPYSIPSAPTSISAVASGDKALTVTVTPNSNEPAGLKLKYKCWSTLNENGAVESDYDQTTIVLSDLAVGQTHTVTCRAKNDQVLDFFSPPASTSSGVVVKGLPPAPTISAVRPGDTTVTLTVVHNGADAAKYFPTTKITCWETKSAATKATDGLQTTYSVPTQDIQMVNLENSKEVTFQCDFFAIL